MSDFDADTVTYERESALQFSDSFSALAKALVAASGKMDGVRKNANNPAFKSKYADLAAVVEAVQPALLEAGLIAIQGATTSHNGVCEVTVETMLLHESGEWVKSALTMRPTKSDPQGIGSAITYARRYGLQALCGVAPEDDDGNAASRKGKDDDQGGQQNVTGAKPTKAQLDALRALYDKAFAGVANAPQVGAWLQKNIPSAADIRQRNPATPTLGEITLAMDALYEIVAANEFARDNNASTQLPLGANGEPIVQKHHCAACGSTVGQAHVVGCPVDEVDGEDDA
jgi:hypothetical protein